MRRTIATPSTFRRIPPIRMRITPTRAPIAATSSTAASPTSCRSSATRAGSRKAVLGGWQAAGIVNISSGQPVSRILVASDTFRRGVFADQVGDPMVGERFVNGVPYWFNPDAFAPPAAGTFGNSGRAPFRQPGRHQWDLNFSKNFYPTSSMRLQFRAELINAFDQRQWLADPAVNGLDNTCTFSNTACNIAGDTFGQNSRHPGRPRNPAWPEVVLVVNASSPSPASNGATRPVCRR